MAAPAFFVTPKRVRKFMSTAFCLFLWIAAFWRRIRRHDLMQIKSGRR